MDCPYIIHVEAIPCNDAFEREITAKPYVDWLKKNDIKNYRWKWKQDSLNQFLEDYETLTFRFEKEADKMQFALRWA